MTSKKFFLFFFVLITNFSYADQFKRIESQNFTVIFPSQIEQDIPKFVNQVNKIYSRTFFSLGKKSERIKIFLGSSSEENAFAYMNVFLPWSKKKIYFINYDFLFSEYLTTIIHEMRHLAQFSYQDNLFKNLSFFSFLTPMLMEGDAVLTETLLTNEGRGRDPFFLRKEKVKILNNVEIKYATLLSENWYTMGYIFCTHIKKNYGIRTFRKLFERRGLYDDLAFSKGYKNVRIFAENFFDRFYPLSTSYRLKRFTGKNFRELFIDIKADLQEKWKQQLENLEISKFVKLNKENCDYYNPQKFNDGVIAFKVSRVDLRNRNELAHFVFLKDGKEEEWLKQFDFFVHNLDFSCAKNKIISRGNKEKLRNLKLPRHLKEADNVIFVVEGGKKSVKIIDKFPYCKDPVLSHDAKKIIFFSPDNDGTPTLIMLDGENFDVLKQHTLEKFHLYKNPIFSYNDKQILFIDSFDGESSIKVIVGDEIKEVYRSKYILRGLDEDENFIFFDSSFSGIDNIYALEKKSKKVFQVTSSKYGAYRPHVVDDCLVYNNFNKRCGYDIAKVKIDVEKWTPIENVEDRNIYLFDGLRAQETQRFTTREILRTVPLSDYEIKNYDIPLLYKFTFQPQVSFSLGKMEEFFDNLCLGVRFYDYHSGVSFGAKFKNDEENSLTNLGVAYTLFDKHEIEFETSAIDCQQNRYRYFSDNILGYNFILKDLIGRNLYFFSPGFRVRFDKEKDTSCLYKVDFNFKTFQSFSTINFALENFNFFFNQRFEYSFDKKNTISLGTYGFKVDSKVVRESSLMVKVLEDNCRFSAIKTFAKKSLSRKELESIKDLRQFGFSLGYIYLLHLGYPLEDLNENLGDEVSEMFLKDIEICPEIKINTSTFDSNEYNLIGNFGVSIRRDIRVFIKFGAKLKDNKISFIPFDFCINANVF